MENLNFNDDSEVVAPKPLKKSTIKHTVLRAHADRLASYITKHHANEPITPELKSSLATVFDIPLKTIDILLNIITEPEVDESKQTAVAENKAQSEVIEPEKNPIQEKAVLPAQSLNQILSFNPKQMFDRLMTIHSKLPNVLCIRQTYPCTDEKSYQNLVEHKKAFYQHLKRHYELTVAACESITYKINHPQQNFWANFDIVRFDKAPRGTQQGIQKVWEEIWQQLTGTEYTLFPIVQKNNIANTIQYVTVSHSLIANKAFNYVITDNLKKFDIISPQEYDVANLTSPLVIEPYKVKENIMKEEEKQENTTSASSATTENVVVAAPINQASITQLSYLHRRYNMSLVKEALAEGMTSPVEIAERYTLNRRTVERYFDDLKEIEKSDVDITLISEEDKRIIQEHKYFKDVREKQDELRNRYTRIDNAIKLLRLNITAISQENKEKLAKKANVDYSVVMERLAILRALKKEKEVTNSAQTEEVMQPIQVEIKVQEETLPVFQNNPNKKDEHMNHQELQEKTSHALQPIIEEAITALEQRKEKLIELDNPVALEVCNYALSVIRIMNIATKL